jgi:23S rRNA pseudouridine1911/1915/1917 synthase
LDAGLIQRLDTHTSGLLVAARTPVAYARLRRALTAGEITKRYYAVVPQALLPGSGIIDWAIVPDRRKRRRVRVDKLRESIAARQAITEWRVAKRGQKWALLEVSVGRAYRHQIRAHLAALGHPIAGDELYGSIPCPLSAGRHALHAYYIYWPGDEVISGFQVDDPVPELFEHLVGSGADA